MSAQFPEALVALWRRSVNTSDDSSFGPQSGSRFDFTLKFEDTILTILPTAILLVFTPFYLRHYYKLPVISAKDPALWVKHVSETAIQELSIRASRTDHVCNAIQAGIISLVILQAVEVAFRVSPDDATDTAKAASIMACLAAVAWPSSCTLSTGTPFSRLRYLVFIFQSLWF